jgi:hypothetical protein
MYGIWIEKGTASAAAASGGPAERYPCLLFSWEGSLQIPDLAVLERTLLAYIAQVCF